MNQTDQTPLKLCLLGANGRLGQALMREFKEWPDLDVSVTAAVDFRLSKEGDWKTKLSELEFDVLINASAFTSVDGCEEHAEEADWINGEAVGLMAGLAGAKDARFIHFSTDYVFDGTKATAYTEEDAPAPLGAYGHSKRLGEERALQANPDSLVIRTAWLFGPDRPSFPEWVLSHMNSAEPLRVVADCFGSPTYTCDLAKWVALLIVRYPHEAGILHLTNSGLCSWNEYAKQILRDLGSPVHAEPIRSDELPHRIAPRPRMSALASRRFSELTGIQPRDWQAALSQHLNGITVPL